MPSIECVQIMRIIKAIRLGWIKPHPGTHKPRVYMLWDEVDQVGDGGRGGGVVGEGREGESGGRKEGGEKRRGREGGTEFDVTKWTKVEVWCIMWVWMCVGVVGVGVV